MGSKGYNDPLITVGGAGVMHATVARHAPPCCHCSRCYAHTSTGAPLRSSCCHPPFSGREAQCNAAHSAARAATRHTLPLPSPSLFPAKPPTPLLLSHSEQVVKLSGILQAFSGPARAPQASAGRWWWLAGFAVLAGRAA